MVNNRTREKRMRSRTRFVLIAAILSLVLAAASTVALAAATGAFRSGTTPPAAACAAPAVPGTVVDVTLMDMAGGMMGAGPMMGGRAAGMMRLHADQQTVTAGPVSLQARNVGSDVHELIVLPLPAGQTAGRRPIGADDRIDETASLGEASRSCGEGKGDGINPGSVGWTSLQLAPGDYELVCNLPGHYAAGMYTTLHVHE
jgi:uncharacterized cupredoxin-like copper-binding protein